jgi:hypothetical protein
MVKVRMKKGLVYKDIIRPTGSIVEMDDKHAEYLCGTEGADYAPGEPLSEVPPMMFIPPKESSKETGKAVADALRDVLIASREPPKAVVKAA